MMGIRSFGVNMCLSQISYEEKNSEISSVPLVLEMIISKKNARMME